MLKYLRTISNCTMKLRNLNNKNSTPLNNFCASCSTNNSIKSKSTTDQSSMHQNNNNDFTPIYKFPYIRICSVINRLKLYQTVIAGVSVPGSLLLQLVGITTLDTTVFVFYTGLVGCVTFFTFGHVFRRFIGFIYYNAKDDTVKIAFADFWGRRKDITVPRSEILPLHDMTKSGVETFHLPLVGFPDLNYLKMNMKYGLIVNQKLFNKVFT